MPAITHHYNDSPATSCQLNRAAWKERLIRHITTAAPPKVLAIHGTWGTGKTSMLAQVYLHFGGEPDRFGLTEKKNRRKDEPPIVPVWFEAWQYQHEENILAALLQEIRSQLTMSFLRKNSKAAGEYLSAGFKAVLQSIDLSIEAFGTRFGIKAGDVAENFQKNLEQKRKTSFAEPMSFKMMKDMLREAINQLLKYNIKGKTKEQPKALIIIDDLDRCEPQTAFRILESIKVYLDLDNCIFLLGMDIRAMDHMLARHYEKQIHKNENFDELKNLSRLYLEKICQDVFHLPLLTQNDRVTYFMELLEGGLEATSPYPAIIRRIVEKYKVLPPFPRSIKMYVNILLHHLQRDQASELEKRACQKLLIVTYLYAFHYELYHLCTAYEDFYNARLLPYCENSFEFEENHGRHPVLCSLIIPPSNEVSEKIAGRTEKEIKSELLTSTYPHANLRQVLWIAPLIRETGGFTVGEFTRITQSAN